MKMPTSTDGLTPLMQQYISLKKEAGDMLLLFRMGDFYEMFYEDAEKASNLLNINLTKRGYFNGIPIPMAGVPANSIEYYLGKLLTKGVSVAISEQLNENTNFKNNLVERKIVRIVTPGTIVEESLLPQKSDISMMAINTGNEEIGLSYLNLANGDFSVIECRSIEETNSELCRILPSEIIIPEEYDISLLGGFKTTYSRVPKWHFEYENAYNKLLEHFQILSLEGFGIKDKSICIGAAGAILRYAYKSQINTLSHIKKLRLESTKQFIFLDPFTRRNLEITQTIHGDKSPTLFSLLDKCCTSMGSRLLRRWLHNPLVDEEQILSRQVAIDSLLPKEGNNNTTLEKRNLKKIREILKEISDLERMTSRIALKSIKPKELINLKDTIKILPSLNKILESNIRSKKIIKIRENLNIDLSIYHLLEKSIALEPSLTIREGGVIANGFDKELDNLRLISKDRNSYLQQLESQERASTKINNLRVSFSKIHGFYIEITKGQIEKTPNHYKRIQTLKNTERFTIPELKTWENKILEAREKSLLRERYLYEQILCLLDKNLSQIIECANAIAEIDLISTLTEHAFIYKWVAPKISDKNEIVIKSGRHPVVESNIETFVPNDCLLNESQKMLIITGPNMGGKSTYMRQVALITLLARIGSFVPAREATIGKIDRIFTRIGASDDIAGGKSTFMVEMTETSIILSSSNQNSLVLIDEIGRGTSTYEGISLAWGIADYLLKVNKSLTLFATHYFELTKMSQIDRTAKNVHMSVIEMNGDLTFLHELKNGPSHQSYGIQVAKKSGIPYEVINRSKEKFNEITKNEIKDINAKISYNEPIENHNKKIREMILDIDITRTTPIEALNKLHELQNIIKKQ